MSNSVPHEDWTSVAASADGAKLVAAGNSGIFVSQSARSPFLNIELLNSNIILSWPVPSTDFVLEQNSDLTPASWMNVTNTPILNLTNLQNEVILSLSNSFGFYRLATH